MLRTNFIGIGFRSPRSHTRLRQSGLRRAKEKVDDDLVIPFSSFHRAYSRLRKPSVGLRVLDSTRTPYLLRHDRDAATSLQSFIARSLIAQPRMSAPFFLGPIFAFLKSGFVIKSTAAVYAFFKSTAAVKFLASAVAYLKSGTAFKAISLSGRVVLGIVSTLKLQARRILRWWHGEADFKALNEARDQVYVAEGRRIPHFQRTTKYLLAVPILFLVIAIAASLERTPVTGRWRIIMKNVDEEASLVEGFLRAGSPPRSHLDWTSPRDWVAILRDVFECNTDPPGTVLGCNVLDPRTDWRAKWVRDVLSSLEEGVKRINLTSENADHLEVFESSDATFIVPPVDHPLVIRPASLKHHGRSEDEHVEGPLLTHFGCLVLDSPIANAGCVGFGPGLQSSKNGNEEAPGVIYVHVGILDEIMRGMQHRLTVSDAQLVPKNAPASTNPVVGLFSNLVNPYSPQVLRPTKREDDELAAILAHELGHLLLSHSLETHSSDDMYGLLTDFFTDLLRTALYPLTAFLGPVFNDWFGQRIRANSSLGLRVTDNCSKRQAEREADLVGLRILVGAGIDPRVLLDIFSKDGVMSRAERNERRKEKLSAREMTKSDPRNVPGDFRRGGDAWDGELWLERRGYFDTHPHNRDRHQTMAEELERWTELGRKEKLASAAAPATPERHADFVRNS